MSALLKFVYDGLTLRDVLLYSALLLATWLFYKAGIEPFLSPIRKIPGLPYVNPLLGNLLYMMSGEAMERSIEMIKEFGPLVRYYFPFGRDRVLVADPDMMKHILLTNSQNYIKPPHRMKILFAVLGNGLVVSEGKLHAMHKRLMMPSFNTHSTEKMVPLFERYGEQLADYWKKSLDENGSAVVPVAADLARTTLDIIGRAAFGYEFRSLTCPDHKVSAAFHAILSGTGLNWRTLLPFAMKLPFGKTREIWTNIHLMNDVVMDIVNKKRRQLQQREGVEQVTSDVLGLMMMAEDAETGKGMTNEELRDQVMTLMLAGHETTAVSMAWCLLMLATHRDIQQKARQELRSVVNDSQPLSCDSLDQLDYCTCVVKETLRCFPAVPMTLRQAENDDVLPGQWRIPAGTILLLSTGPMMRREELFHDADKFNPERFLHTESGSKDGSSYHFVPFLYGPRQCLAHRFAVVEMRALLAVLLRHFEFDLDPAGPAVYRRHLGITMRPDPPLQLRVSLASTQ